MITQIELKEWLTYDPITGIFRWIPRPRSSRIEYKAGCQRRDGYVIISFKGTQYLAHRLAFLYMTGSFPEKQVDHIDRKRNNNKWDNLREVTPQQNNFNRTGNRILPIGVYEVTRNNRKGIWYATKIQKDGKQYSSYFRKLEDALDWRIEKENQLFGEIV